MNSCINICHDDFEAQIKLLFGKTRAAANNNKKFDSDYDRFMETLCVCKMKCALNNQKPGPLVACSPVQK